MFRCQTFILRAGTRWYVFFFFAESGTVDSSLMMDLYTDFLSFIFPVVRVDNSHGSLQLYD